MNQPGAGRLEELAVDEALGLLTPEGRAELQQLQQQFPDQTHAGIERAVAAVIAAKLAAELEPMPELLARRVQADGLRFLAGAGAGAPAVVAANDRPMRSPLSRVAGWTGWALAAGLAAALWLVPQKPRAPEPAPAFALSATPQGQVLEEARGRVLSGAGAVFKQSFAPGPDPTGVAVKGDVVWDDRSQQGYLRLAGLRPNDPAREEYQLWIFDAERDQRYPVDGGVFDVAADGSTIVRIRAAIKVHHAVLFAITVEKPGGVVVSSRERVAGLAKAG